MVINFNPFAGLIETRAYPHARAYRTTLRQKLLDTFLIFFGYFNSKDKKNSHAGVFDYIPLLGLIPLLDKAHDYLLNRYGNESSAAAALRYTLTCLQLFFALPRIVFAAVLTAICIIPVYIISWAVSKKSGELKNEINSFIPDASDAETSSTNTVAQSLQIQHTCLEEICDIKVTEAMDTPNIKTLQFFAPTVQPESVTHDEDHLMLEDETVRPEEETQHEVLKIDIDTTKHPRFFQTLKELNVGGILSKQEAEERAGYWL